MPRLFGRLLVRAVPSFGNAMTSPCSVPGPVTSGPAALTLPCWQRPEAAWPEELHDVLQAVADSLDAVGILDLQPRLFLLHRDLDAFRHRRLELLGPQWPANAVQNPRTADQDVGAREVRRYSRASRLEDEGDP